MTLDFSFTYAEEGASGRHRPCLTRMQSDAKFFLLAKPEPNILQTDSIRYFVGRFGPKI